MKHVFLFLIISFILKVQICFSQNKENQNINFLNITASINIDGNLDENEWNNAEIASNFIQSKPNPGFFSSQKTSVKVLYDNSAIYVGAMLYENYPDSISNELTQRDNTGTADFFGILLDTYGDELTGFYFIVTAAGVQEDTKVYANGNSDNSWDAVWKSDVRKTEYGWSVEMKIPYSCIRFSDLEIQNWRVNFLRYISRKKEYCSWCKIDPSAGNMNSFNGKALGVKNIKSPIRLSISPFIASYVEKYDSKKTKFSLRGGMDLKYGITESYTLDMMLIPDFGQVQSDDVYLNLSPFEVYYGEKRPFFTEGTELFKRANIFYSRRIGGNPKLFYSLSDELKNSEIIDKNPSELQLLNATKISGKSKNGTSFGFLNAMSLKSQAEIKDTLTGTNRNFTTQNFTNYNVTVFDQTFHKNSYFSLINTNYLTPNNKNFANVTGTELNLKDNQNKYSFFTRSALSQVSKDSTPTIYGHYYNFQLSKTSGSFQFTLSHLTENDKYNPNDMGYLQSNNEFSNSISLSYHIFKPFWRMLNWHTYYSFSHGMLYKPRHYTEINSYLNTYATFKNYVTAAIEIWNRPGNSYDFYEPRKEGKFLVKPSIGSYGGWISTNYNKKLALDINLGIWYSAKYKEKGNWFAISPRIKPSNKMLFVYTFQIQWTGNELGYSGASDDESKIYFGLRKNNNYTNTLECQYIFNKKSFFSVRTRYLWSTIEYKNYFQLEENGTLTTDNSNYKADNINFNIFNVDFVYNWEFAPGSFVSIAWKNQILQDESSEILSYKENIKNTFNTPQVNNFSIKILYYFDYLYLTKKH